MGAESGKTRVFENGALPRGLSRAAAAHYLGIGTTTFDGLVKDGVMPKPKTIGARRVWDRHKLDAAFDELPGDEDAGHDDIWNDVHA